MVAGGRRVVRLLGALVIGALGLAPVTALATAAPAAAAPGRQGVRQDQPLPPGTVDTEWGPLTPADRDLVVKVRLAGLWEMPAGTMAAEKGQAQRVREVGAEIAKQHKQLDKLVVEAAGKLGVELPDEPNTDQQFWLGEMRAASGAGFDRVFIDRLRAAHGKVFPAIANIRSGTRNDVVRKLAQDSNGFVLTHLTLLESSGLVDYQSLPLPPAPATANPDAVRNDMLVSSKALTGGVNSMIIWAVLAFAVIAGIAATLRLVRPRR